MKTVTITDIMADFLDSIREYEHESGEAIHYDERESSEFVDMYFNGGGKINIEESNADEYIWKNRRVFSYNDMVNSKLCDWQINSETGCDEWIELAKERVEE